MKSTNASQFTSSYKDWNKAQEQQVADSIDKEVSSYIPDDDFYTEAFKAYVSENISNLWTEFENGLMYCESPIEKMMMAALAIVGGRQVFVGFKVKKMYFGRDVESSAEHLLIAPQAELGSYRVDFLLTMTIIAPKFELIDGESKATGDNKVIKQMILECDGHDYHERTKEQAKNDRTRDRTLQQLGYLVFRYTGSEIWEDVFKCAQDAVNTLYKQTNDEAWGFKDEKTQTD